MLGTDMEPEQIQRTKEPQQAPRPVSPKAMTHMIAQETRDLISYDSNQAAQLLGITVASMKKLIRAGDLPAFYLGGRIRVTGRDLRDFQDRLKRRVAQDFKRLAETHTPTGDRSHLYQSRAAA